MSMFRELKAKKATFGFTAGMYAGHAIAMGMFLGVALRGAKEGRDFTVESNQSGTNHDIKIYTNDPALASHIRDVNSLDVPLDNQAFLDGGNLFEKAMQARYAIGDTNNDPHA